VGVGGWRRLWRAEAGADDLRADPGTAATGIERDDYDGGSVGGSSIHQWAFFALSASPGARSGRWCRPSPIESITDRRHAGGWRPGHHGGDGDAPPDVPDPAPRAPGRLRRPRALARPRRAAVHGTGPRACRCGRAGLGVRPRQDLVTALVAVLGLPGLVEATVGTGAFWRSSGSRCGPPGVGSPTGRGTRSTCSSTAPSRCRSSTSSPGRLRRPAGAAGAVDARTATQAHAASLRPRNICATAKVVVRHL
jgi:hypothetical protein